MWCPEEEKKEKREEKSMPALFMEINRQYGMTLFLISLTNHI